MGDIKIIMEGWRSYLHEKAGDEAYAHYKDKLSTKKDGEEEEELEAGEVRAYKTKKSDAVKIIDPENEHGATIVQPVGDDCKPVSKNSFAAKGDKIGEPVEKCDTDGEKGSEDIEAGDAFEYTSKKGNKLAITVVDPSHEKSNNVIAKRIDPNSCEPKGSQFAAGTPDVFAQKAGDPIDKCNAGGGGESQIAQLISQKLAQTGLDDYIKKITKRNDLYELEKIILNLALDSKSPIKAQDVLRVVIDLKKDIEGKMKANAGGDEQ